jgi:hypothetical protein
VGVVGGGEKGIEKVEKILEEKAKYLQKGWNKAKKSACGGTINISWDGRWTFFGAGGGVN